MNELKIRKVRDCVWEVEKSGRMNVPVEIYASGALLEKMKADKCIFQGVNVACMPGIVKKSVMMPDAHQGYGFSIGGVAAFDERDGCITPGGIGFDINCGVRLLTTPVPEKAVRMKIRELTDSLFRNVPAGVGGTSFLKLSDEELEGVLRNGASWAVERGFGIPDDLEFCEENGRMDCADPSKVSARAKARGRKQLGTLGAGNHFLEVQKVEDVYDEKVASVFGLERGAVCVMIHCGSRGLGHQVCSDYLREMEEKYPELAASLPEKDLMYAPAGSMIASDYYGAMCAAANFAWANRQIISHQVRKSFREVFNTMDSDIRLVYDVAHNIAKLEEHDVDGLKRRLWVHRKGATRAFPAGAEGVPPAYSSVGHPVLIPGSMGTSSYVLVGTKSAMMHTFGSSAHGAGRTMSRVQAKRYYPGERVKRELAERNITVRAASLKGISEEAPEAYKDVSEVVRVTEKAGIARIIAKLVPIGVVKG